MKLPNVLRDHGVVEEREVTRAELFFDLVYVFAFIQLSHYLLEHLTLRGAIETPRRPWSRSPSRSPSGRPRGRTMRSGRRGSHRPATT